MTVKNDPDRGIRFLVVAAALVIIIGGINQAQSVLVSFLVAVFFRYHRDAACALARA